ncbi:MAG: hypothetical protein F4177_07480 [Chloroflexi bacterium]|nr:hypothetical protein [Chloroflexota bacterium]
MSESQLAEIRPHCGDLRPAQSVSAYLSRFSWTETDIVVAGGLNQTEIDAGVNVLTIGPMSLGLRQRKGKHPAEPFRERVRMDMQNRERGVGVVFGCPPMYSGPAELLAKQLRALDEPPPTVTVTDAGERLRQPIVETSGGCPVALRLHWAGRVWGGSQAGPTVDVVALHLPSQAGLLPWFRAFLTDIGEFDPERVPAPPSLLSEPSHWYTPKQDQLAREIDEVERERGRLESQQQRLEEELASEGRRADETVLRTICEDGDELVDAVGEMLEEIGFAVQRMDDAKPPHEAKHEDLRLRLASRLDWEAIVEVKGYTKGIRAKDAQQVRMHRERYNRDTGREPSLTIWLVNPWREMEPSDRPSPDKQIDESAEIVGAVCLHTTDLYLLWKSLKTGDSSLDEIVRRLVEAEAGLWRPSLNPRSSADIPPAASFRSFIVTKILLPSRPRSRHVHFVQITQQFDGRRVTLESGREPVIGAGLEPRRSSAPVL